MYILKAHMAKTATPRKIVALITKRGFTFLRQKGSHAIYTDTKGTLVIVPMHAKEISKGTLSRILKTAGLTTQDL